MTPALSKPFDLSACIRGEPVVTREGKPFKFGAHRTDGSPDQRLIGWHSVDGAEDSVANWFDDGRFLGGPNSRFDLFMAEPE